MTTSRRVCAAAVAALLVAQVAACGSSDTTETIRATVSAPAPLTTAALPAASPRPKRSEAQAEPTPFTFESRPLSGSVRRRVTGHSWHEGCPVGLAALRFIRMNYWGFDRKIHRGEMIVNATAVVVVRTAFERLFAKRFPIRKMRLVDAYRADDYTSIEADNTSAFNCRNATGSSRWSMHAYGRAIDINPIENPYVYADGTTTHRASRRYLDRSRYRPGMALRGRVLVEAFEAAGWGWGGSLAPARDYQHFSPTGR